MVSVACWRVCTVLAGGGGPTALLITGPNMGGKSTTLRQAAVLTVLAQVRALVCTVLRALNDRALCHTRGSPT